MRARRVSRRKKRTKRRIENWDIALSRQHTLRARKTEVRNVDLNLSIDNLRSTIVIIVLDSGNTIGSILRS
jgi:hypothetical protein